MPGELRLAILGCGEVTRLCHLPVAARHPDVRVTGLVDSNVSRADDMRRSYGLNCEVTSDYTQVFPNADAIINALPNRLHASVTMDAFRAGLHVLCEKPLATTSTDARACCEAASQKRLTLAVGMQRRFNPNHKLMRLLLDEGTLGSLESYEWVYGTSWDWGTRSGFYFSRAEAGGGILIDFGPHLLDELVDWFGPVEHFDYQDDNLGGGIEANTLLNLHHSGRYGQVHGLVRLSRTYNLKNRMVLCGALAQLEVPPHDPNILVMRRVIGGKDVNTILRWSGQEDISPTQPYYDQLDNFIQSVRGAAQPVADGWQALAITELIENCYAQAKRIPEPWDEVAKITEKVRE